MKEFFTLNEAETQALQHLLANSEFVDTNSLQTMSNSACESGCTGWCDGSCQGSCQGSCSNTCAGSCWGTCAGGLSRNMRKWERITDYRLKELPVT